MPTLDVDISKFKSPYDSINGFHSVPVSRLSCMKHALSFGSQFGFGVYQDPIPAFAFAIYKMLTVVTAVDFSNYALRRTPVFEDLDSTEKANISFWIGMTFCSLLANRFLNIPRLIHAASYKKLGLLTVKSGRSLADFVGQDISNNWHSIEAKARQRRPSRKIERKWKKQAQTITHINSNVVATTSYSFTGLKNLMDAELVDPEINSKQNDTAIEFEQNYILNGYYKPINVWLDNNTQNLPLNNDEVAIKLAGYDLGNEEFIFLGLTQRIRSAAKDSDIPKLIKPSETENGYIGSDGVVLMTSKEPII